MIRRMKDDVLTMEGKFRQEPLLSASDQQMTEYHGFMDDDTLIPLQKINLGRQWLERVKREPILEMLGDLQQDAKAIIFCNFEATVEWFMDQMPAGSAVRLTGKESRKQRDRAVQKFQNDPECRWFVANIKAAGVGLNLTAATYVFFVSRPWTPADQTQAEDRAYRIGQNRRVEIYIPTIPDTIDEQIKALIQNKAEITADVLVGALDAGKRRALEQVADH
jgi:SNF2 family DNA or RNA helicase